MNMEMTDKNIDQLDLQSPPPVRLSASPVWDIQKNYYKTLGIRAWEPSAVPSYITTNPFIAHCYARVIRGFFDDYRGDSPHDGKRYIIELGAGTGCFAYRFLKHFFAEDQSNLENITYIMTDISEANINFWRTHPQFTHYIDAGQLDFAYYDATSSESLELLVSGEHINEKSVDTPLAAIANYVIDSMPHDLFGIVNHGLHERLVTHSADCETGDIKKAVDNSSFSYTLKSCDPEYYHNNVWNAILREYTEEQSELELAIPVGGFQAIDSLRSFTEQPVFLLSADFGESSIHPLRDLPPRKVVKNGAFSLHVNYHALTRYTELTGGRSFITEQSHSSLAIAGLLLRQNASQCSALNEAFNRHIKEFGPDEFFMLKKITEKRFAQLSLNEIIALLRISCWDSKILLGCRHALIENYHQASRWQKRTLWQALRNVQNMHFRCDNTRDCWQAVEDLLEHCDDFGDAED